MRPDNSSTWFALLAAVGFGTIIASIVAWWSAKAVTIANHRQNWINALREDLVLYLKDVDDVHLRVGKLASSTADSNGVDRLQKSRNSALLVYRRILLRLNTHERLHIQLAEALKALLLVQDPVADPTKVDAALDLARKVLKYEWAVTKYGIFTSLVLPIKGSLREMTDED